MSALLYTIAISLAAASVASAAPPAPCTAAPQITDSDTDGHHDNTDVVAAWLTESGGRLQAVVRVDVADWAPAHEDSESRRRVALLYQVGGATRYVRVEMYRDGVPPAYDHGTWSAAGGFATDGPTAGAVTSGSNGTVTLDVPAVGAGTVLARPFVLSYDGAEFTDLHWVDRGPGGTTPDGTEFGADFVAGSCSGTPVNPGDPGNPVTPGTGATPGAVRTTAVSLSAPKRVTGSRRATVRGRVSPARAGVTVEVTTTGRRTAVRRTTTGADGSFSLRVPFTETTRVRAVADGLGSQTLTVQMLSKVRIKVRRLASGAVVVSGTTSPKLSGRILWLRSNAVRPSARTTARNGRFTLRFEQARPGRYQAIFIPSGDRAERSTSNTGVVR